MGLTSNRRNRRRSTVALAALAFACTAQNAGAVPGWVLTGGMGAARQAHTATGLPDGRVLVTGGSPSIMSGSAAVSTAELYDPASGAWSPAAAMSTARAGHTATLLPGGRVLVAGGSDGGAGSLASAEVYDPATNSWSPTGSMTTARAYGTATSLPDGRVLVAGGNLATATAELYNPATGTWSSAGNMVLERVLHTATLLGNGSVLVAGGRSSGGGATWSAELYDIGTNTWSLTANMSQLRAAHAAAPLPDGRVLVAGSDTGPPASAELYNPGPNTWSPTGSMSAGRYLHTATAMLDGTVLVAGGGPSTSELYDPAAGTWGRGLPMAAFHSRGTATLLAGGKVLVAGGVDGSYRAVGIAERYPEEPRVCFDGLDNDGDGRIDDADPGCENRFDNDETDPDEDAPSARLARRAAQTLKRTITASVQCGAAEDCIVSAQGRLSVPGAARSFSLTPIAPRTVARGKQATLKFRVPARARTAGLRALRNRRTVRATITVTVADAAGNRRTLRGRLKIKR